MIKQLLLLFITLGLSLIHTSCTRSPIKSSDEAMKVIELDDLQESDFVDDDFLMDLGNHLSYWNSLKDSQDKILKFGPYKIKSSDYIKALQGLYDYCSQTKRKEKCSKYIKKHFVPLAVYGRDDWADVFMTSYYSPLIEARKKPEGAWTQPIYSRPDDLVEIDLRTFAKYSTLSHFDNPQFKSSMPDLLRGRIVVEGNQKKVLPYFTREEISKGALGSQKLETYYVDPLDAFFLQIQGSGTLILPNAERINIVYDGQNGHRYEAIGKFLKDKIPLEDLNLHTIEAHLRTLPAEEMNAVLNRNPSYVFFKKSDKSATTSFGIMAQAKRTIATDPKYFPKGALGLLIFQEPIFSKDSELLPQGFNVSHRLVFDHDTGGAIKGADRLDFYWGTGPEAKRAAGLIKDRAQLYYWFPRSAL